MSNASVMSIASVIIISGGCFMLNHMVIVLFIVCSAVTAEWFVLN